MNAKKKNIPVPDPEKQDLEYVCPSASWGDMTGLIPAITGQEGARDSYEEMYPYMPKYSPEEQREH